MSEGRVTRGQGVLEGFLARKRTHMANSLVPRGSRAGRVLDIGCGNRPYFLAHSEFAEKYGLDRLQRDEPAEVTDQAIRLIDHDVQSQPLPFDDEYFDVVTMLAVFEHLEPPRAPGVLGEVRRVLKTGGTYIITTPAPWTDIILRTMVKLRLISGEEIEEHKNLCGREQIVVLLSEAGFEAQRIQTGAFELGMNLWVTAGKG